MLLYDTAARICRHKWNNTVKKEHSDKREYFQNRKEEITCYILLTSSCRREASASYRFKA